MGPDESPWASPGEPFSPPTTPYDAPYPPAETPAPQAVPAPSPYAVAYAPAYPGGGFAPNVAPPAWATPPAIPPRGARSGLDPYRVRGWRGGGSIALRLLAFVAVVAGLMTVAMVGAVVGERAFARDERAHYVEAQGNVETGDDGDPMFVGYAEGYGAVRMSLADAADSEDVYEGNHIALLVALDDPSWYILPGERADPGGALATLVVVGVIALGAGIAAFLVHRARRVQLDAVRHVAVEIPPGGPPPPLTEPLRARRRGTVLRLAGATVLLAVAVPAGVFAARDVGTVTETTTTQGSVVEGTDDAGNATPEVRYYDAQIDSENVRPLSPAERARGAAVGDTIDVTYVLPDATIGHGHDVALAELAAVAGLAAVALLRRALLWPRRLRRAQHAEPYPAEVTAWVRVVLRRPWLVVVAPGTTKARQALAIPLSNEREIPAAIAGTVYVQGRLRPGHAVILRAPNGAVIAPSGPARRALLAELSFVGTAPPLPPAQVAYGYATPW